MQTSVWSVEALTYGNRAIWYQICYALMILFACVIEGLMARTIFRNKKKVWIVVATTAITNLVANAHLNSGYMVSSGLIDRGPLEDAVNTATSRSSIDKFWISFNSAFAHTPLGAFLKLLAIITIVETIVIIVEWLVYKFTHACKYSFLFSLDANITSFSLWELIQLILLSPTTAFGNPVSIFKLDANTIAFGDNWNDFFSQAETAPLLRLSMLVCAALVAAGIALMFVLRTLEKKADQKTIVANEDSTP